MLRTVAPIVTTTPIVTRIPIVTRTPITNPPRDKCCPACLNPLTLLKFCISKEQRRSFAQPASRTTSTQVRPTSRIPLTQARVASRTTSTQARPASLTTLTQAWPASPTSTRALPLLEQRLTKLNPLLGQRLSKLDPLLRQRLAKLDPLLRQRLPKLKPLLGQHLPKLKLLLGQSTKARPAPTMESAETVIVSAVNAILVPKELVNPHIHIRPPGSFIAIESVLWRTWFERMGVKEVAKDDYIRKHLLPGIRKNPNAPGISQALMTILKVIMSEGDVNRMEELIYNEIIPLIRGMSIEDPNRNGSLQIIFDFINRNIILKKSQLAKGHIIPNRRDQLCRASELFDPDELFFVRCFNDDDSKFPNKDFKLTVLRNLGIQTKISPKYIGECLEYFVRDVQEGDQPLLSVNPARDIWKRFCDEQGNIWTKEDLAAIAKYRFIPIAKYKVGDTESYRDTIPLPSKERLLFTSLSEMIEPAYMAIAWTQAFIPEQSPTRWINRLYGITPTIERVVQHLVKLATIVSPYCSVHCVDFFNDLRATYN